MNTRNIATTPQSVCIAGALCILTGVGAVIHIVVSLLYGQIWINLAFVGIPIGYGLLAGKPSSRRWALVISCGGLVLFLLLAIWFAYANVTSPEQFSAIDTVASTVIFGLATGACAFVFFALIRPEIRGWFYAPREAPASGRQWAFPLLIVTGGVMVWQAVEELQLRETFTDLFAIHTTIIPYNAETGERVQSISWERPDRSPWRVRTGHESLPNIVVSTAGSPEGTEIRVRGVASRPVTLVIRSRGLEDGVVEITRTMEPELRVPMLPEKAVSDL